MSGFRFKLHRAKIAQRGMQSLAVIPGFDIGKEGRARRGTAWERLGGAFGFESGEETLHSSIVVAIANPAHADFALMHCQAVAIIGAGILAALIGVMQ